MKKGRQQWRCSACGRFLTNRVVATTTAVGVGPGECMKHQGEKPILWTHARRYAMDYVSRVPDLVAQARQEGDAWLGAYYPGVTVEQLKEAISLANRWWGEEGETPRP